MRRAVYFGVSGAAALILSSAVLWAAGPAVELLNPQSDDQGHYVPVAGPQGVTLYGLVAGATVQAVTVNGLEAKLFPAGQAGSPSYGATAGGKATLFRAYANLKPDTVIEASVDGQKATFKPAAGATIDRLWTLVQAARAEALPHYRLGNALVNADRADAAIDQYRLALKADPKLAAAHVGLGNALRAEGQAELARGTYAGAIGPEDYGPHFHPGARSCEGIGAHLESRENIARSQERLIGAITEYRKATELAPRDFEAYLNLGVSLCEAKKAGEGIAALRQAVDVDPQDLEAHAFLGCALRKAGQYEEAIAEQRRAIMLRSDYAPSHYCLAQSLYATGDYAGAWEEVHLAQMYGASPSAAFLKALRAKGPEPQRQT